MTRARSIAAGILALGILVFLGGCTSKRSTTTEAAGPNPATGAIQPVNADNTPADQAPQSPQSQSLTIPAGTIIEVRLGNPLSSARDRRGDSFQATLADPILVNGMQVVPKGANVTGRVVAAEASGHLRTPAELALTLTALHLDGQAYEIRTSDFRRREESHAKHDAKWIGALAGGGALLGALVGHGEGAAIGAGIGAGAGTATAYETGKKDIYLPSETRLRFVLREPVTVTVTG